MSDFFVDNQARADFNKARSKEVFTWILNMLSPDRYELLSLQDVRSMVKPKSEFYQGLRTVPVSLIAGSEGRYKDFNRQFLPRRQHLRYRWESIDKAHIINKNLPPIKLYEVGGVYFVRDGNHRVSVAVSQGAEFIDAEVIQLDSTIHITPEMTKTELKGKVIEYERKEFFKRTGLHKLRRDCILEFTATGRYNEIVEHIVSHGINMEKNLGQKVSFDNAMVDWYDNIYFPIVQIIRNNNMGDRFPGRTESDLYVWVARHTRELRKKYGKQITYKKAAEDYNEKYGKNFWQKVKMIWQQLFAKK